MNRTIPLNATAFVVNLSGVFLQVFDPHKVFARASLGFLLTHIHRGLNPHRVFLFATLRYLLSHAHQGLTMPNLSHLHQIHFGPFQFLAHQIDEINAVFFIAVDRSVGTTLAQK